MAEEPVATADPFVHEALFYRSVDEFLAGTVPFVREGMTVGEPVLVATPPGNGKLVRDELGAVADGVWFEDMTQAGRNPGRIIPSVLLAFAAAHPGRRVRIVGEPIWPGRTEIEYPACALHETLINLAFHGRDAAILCPYDAAGLAAAVIEDAGRTHPVLVDAEGRERSAGYGPVPSVVARFNRPLPEPPERASTMEFTMDGLAEVRAATAAYAAGVAIPTDRASDFVVAVNEVATNSVRHGGGRGTVWLWIQNGTLVVQIHDAGHIADPLAGRVPPPPESQGQLGLLLVNQLCDLVRVHTDAIGTTIRLHQSGRLVEG